MNKQQLLDLIFLINLGLLLGCGIVCMACPRQYTDIVYGFAAATAALLLTLIIVLTVNDHYHEQQYQANNIKG